MTDDRDRRRRARPDLTGDDGKPEEKKPRRAEEPKKRRLRLSKMMPTGGGEKKQAQVTASGGARGVDPEKDSKGGPNPEPVAGEARRRLTSPRSRRKEGLP